MLSIAAVLVLPVRIDHRLRMSLFNLLAGSLASTGAMGLIAASPALLPPTGRWVVDYAESRCTAERAFGTAEKPLHLLIKPSPSSDVVQIAIVKNGANYPGVQDDATIDLGDGAPLKVKQLRYGVDKKSVRLVNLSQEQAARLATAKTISWRASGGDTALNTGAMSAVMKTLANCRDDLRDYWNIGPEKESLLRSPVIITTPLQDLFSTDDYPRQAVINGESGMVSIVLLVDEKGVLRDCMIDGTSGVATIDAVTCINLRKKGHFNPATGTDGKPVRGAVKHRIRWVMP